MAQEQEQKNVKSSKLLALTFDDGPSETTSQVLDVLQQYNVVATFFLVGEHVNEGTKPVMQRQVAMGCEIANHSYTHSNMSIMSLAQIKQEIEDTTARIKEMVGYDVKFFRPPYIALSDIMYETIDLPFIQGIGCTDWEPEVSAEQRTETIMNTVKDGTIILLHDFEGNENTVDALPHIIEELKKQGYKFVTVSDLFRLKGVNPNVKYKIWTNVYE